MRVVTLGVPLANPRVDNHSIANAPSLFEYDACVIDSRAVSQQIEEIVAGSSNLRTTDDLPLQAGASGAFHYGLGELIQQRRRELERLLEKGGMIVVFAHPNVPHTAISSLPGADRYSILPAATGVLYRAPHLVPGDGRNVHALDPKHPFAIYLDDLTRQIRYRAHWETAAIPDFDSLGTVFGRSEGGADVAVEFRAGAGRIFFLPPMATNLRGSARRPFVEAMLDSIQRAIEDPGAEQAPLWIKGYDLPNLATTETQLVAAQDGFAEAESALVEARAFYSDAARFHALLWRGGHYAFEPVVRDAFRALGFRVSADLNAPAVLHDESDPGGEFDALLEIDSSDGTVREQSYLNLQRRIEAEFLRSGHRRKGVIVVNGERRHAPERRTKPYSDALANACLNFGYALVTGESLFALVSYALEGADAETLTAIRQTIVDTEGLLEVEEQDDDEQADASVADVDDVADAVETASAPSNASDAADGADDGDDAPEAEPAPASTEAAD